MQAVQNLSLLSVADYLAGELKSEMRHEYLGGLVYAMAGSSAEHNLIIGNLLAALRSALRLRPPAASGGGMMPNVMFVGW